MTGEPGPVTLSAGSLTELEIERLTGSGDGIAHLPSGRLVFVPRTAPGDRVEVRITENRARWARARVERLIAGGPGRRQPACGYYEECGGCRTQHLSEALRLEALRSGVVDALRRIGGSEVAVDSIEPAPDAFGYRNRVTFTVRRRGDRVTAGYHRIEGPRLLDVEACPLAEPAVGTAWRALRAAWGPGGRYLPGSRGREIRLTLRATSAGDVGLLVVGGETPGAPERLLTGPGAPVSIWWRPSRGKRVHLGGRHTLEETWDGERVELWPEAFLQVNRKVSAELERHLDDGLGPLAGKRVIDLYAGIGLRAVRWARQGAEVVAVDAASDAIRSGRRLSTDAGTEVTFVEGSVEGALADPRPANIVVANPPRTGLSSEACERLARLPAERLVYVSCDPATLARDAVRLAPGWVPARARPFDAFPQTGHVETVLWFESAGGGDDS